MKSYKGVWLSGINLNSPHGSRVMSVDDNATQLWDSLILFSIQTPAARSGEHGLVGIAQEAGLYLAKQKKIQPLQLSPLLISGYTLTIPILRPCPTTELN